jgi:anti-sigma B factor antagonist
VGLSVARRGFAVDVGIDGVFTSEDRRDLRRAVLEELDRGARHFRIDFARAVSVDSSGFGALISISKHIREGRGDLRLANLRPELRTLFALTKLDLLFAIDGDGGTAGRRPPLRPTPRGPRTGHAEPDGG